MRQELVELTVPGMKMHMRRDHGEAAYLRVKWPSLHRGALYQPRAKPGSLAAMKINELRQEAARLGVSSYRLSKKELARAILRATE
jgi:hypothetical protein